MGAGHGFGDWPNNLMKALEIEIDPLKAIGDDGNAEIAMAFANLTGREKAAVRMRFADEMTLVAIGDKLEISQERARQILAKALRKLRHPVPWYILKNGIRDYLDRKIEEIVTIQTAAIREELEKEYAAKLAGANDEVVDKMSIRVEELDLSVRAYNCLKRSGCNTVGDLLTKYPTIEESLKIRNLGRRSMDEITRSLWSHGIVWPREDVDRLIVRKNLPDGII